jgi:hypothetical protein
MLVAALSLLEAEISPVAVSPNAISNWEYFNFCPYVCLLKQHIYNALVESL